MKQALLLAITATALLTGCGSVDEPALVRAPDNEAGVIVTTKETHETPSLPDLALQTGAGAEPDGGVSPDAARKRRETPPQARRQTVPLYPAALPSWESPNSEPRRKGAVIRYIYLHHTANAVDHRAYFSRRNERRVAPNLYPRPDGTVYEIVPLARRAFTTAVASDHEAITFEIESAGVFTDAQYEALARFAAWLSQQIRIENIPVAYRLDRAHTLGHREVPGVTSGTLCPGDLDIDRIVFRAQAIVAAETATARSADGP